MTPDRYRHQRYLLMTLDPVHPGAGGYRLGRVDNSIAREPGTRLPKIPGSSLHGAARTYAAYLYETPAAAGQNQDEIINPAQNPVSYTFGYLNKKGEPNEKASSGVVNLFDAHILLFPVHSMLGPVWVSTAQRLQDAGFTINAPQIHADEILTTLPNCTRLNLGWLMLNVHPSPLGRGAGGEGHPSPLGRGAGGEGHPSPLGRGAGGEGHPSPLGNTPAGVQSEGADNENIQPPTEWQSEAWNTIKDRIVLVSDSLFSHIVNSNLEVRTSVAINPETGAAEDKALYTYEAIPRATFLTAEVVLDDYNADKNNRPFPVEKTEKGNPLPGEKWQNPLDVVKAGLKMIEYLSVGGMGTRGFGRIKIIENPAEKTQQQIFNAFSQEQ